MEDNYNKNKAGQTKSENQQKEKDRMRNGLKKNTEIRQRGDENEK